LKNNVYATFLNTYYADWNKQFSESPAK